MMKSSANILAAALVLASACAPRVENPADVDAVPQIWPDYVGVTVPSTIAPLNFGMKDEEAFDAMAVRVTAPDGSTLEVRGALAQFPLRKWHRILGAARGSALEFEVCARSDGQWRRFKPFTVEVSEDEMDYGLNYRLIAPGYHNYTAMGIYERNLSNFKERALIVNSQFNGCVNCHSYNRCDPSDLSLHVRGEHGATLIRKDGKMAAYNTKVDGSIGFCVYPYWHPEGKYIAYSSNRTMQSFHVGSAKLVEVYDLESDVQIYDVEANRLLRYPQLCGDQAFETFPSFSPDGKTLYFCRALPVKLPISIREARYDLWKASFDPQTGEIGEPEPLLELAALGKSISFPRPSFDGRFIMYTLSDYGNFSIWHPESDLWLLDLETGRTRPLNEVNSPFADSYHNFSSNSRWFVLGTRRDDREFTVPYLAHIDADGNVTKPFLLPQKDPRSYYRTQMRSYNIPEFVSAPVQLGRKKAQRLINSPSRVQFQ